MTNAEYKAAHIEMWQWLYDNPEKNKKDWPGWNFNGGQYTFNVSLCFACVLATERSTDIPCAYCCPLDQNVMKGCGDDSPYAKWHDVAKDDATTRQKYAALIRDAWR
jgi:hypothetical protein